ncbi:MAG: FAD-dependent oxidoreductase [Bacteroidota bacterium]
MAIGAGSAGLSISLSMNKLGFKTLLIDKDENNIGGDCLNTGCVPSKALIHISRLVSDARKASEFGLNISGKVDIDKVMKYISDKQEIIRDHENADYFRKEGLDVVIGEARFNSTNSLVVNDKPYTAKRYVIATGSKPKELQLPGIDNIQSFTNEDVFDLNELPKNMIVIGAGPIGLELGQAFSRLGVNISIVDIADRILPKEDAEIADILKEQLESEGISFYLKAHPKEVTDRRELIIEKEGSARKLPCDAILFAIGRTLNHNGLDLEKAQVKIEGGKIWTNKYLRTSNKRVYVCGDAVGSLQFSHGAELHARIILNNFFSPLKKKLTYKNFSWVTFTDPEVATFGWSQSDLEQSGTPFERLELDFKDDDRAIVDNYQYGQLILFVEKTNFIRRNPKVLGGSIIAPGAGEICQELVLANSSGIRLDSFFNKIYSYPTASRVNQAIVVNKKMTEITPSVKKMLKIIY